jgi:hypothetical protein
MGRKADLDLGGGRRGRRGGEGEGEERKKEYRQGGDGWREGVEGERECRLRKRERINS